MSDCECKVSVGKIERRYLVGEAVFCQKCGGYIADNFEDVLQVEW